MFIQILETGFGQCLGFLIIWIIYEPLCDSINYVLESINYVLLLMHKHCMCAMLQNKCV